MDIENIHSKSLLTICGIQKHACGYCKITDHDTSISYGVIFDSLNSSDYEKLMYHGFRRSGNYVYRPIMHLVIVM
jgi:arginine-tRNA-protein transferase